MVNLSDRRLDAVFHALSDPTRRAIIRSLARGESAVSRLARPFEMSLPAVSKHLGVLEEANLVRREKRGRVHFCKVNPQAMMEAAEWLARYRDFWEGRFDALERFLASPHERRPRKRRDSRRKRHR